jgi:hypothetical protein
VEYAVEGGYANLMRSVAVHDDGRLDLVRGGVRSVTHWPAHRVQRLVALLEAAGLFDEDREFPAPVGADLRRHQIRYAGVTVVAHDPSVPPELATAISLLEQALTTP